MDGERTAAASAAGRTDEVMCKGRISRPASVTSPGRRDVTRTSRPLSRRVHETSKTPCYSLLQLRSLATGDRWSDTPSATTTPPLTRRRTSPGQLSASCITIITIIRRMWQLLTHWQHPTCRKMRYRQEVLQRPRLQERRRSTVPVSYTHLTLPTNREV